MLRIALVAFAAALAFPSPVDAQWPLTSCTPLGQNLFVRDVLHDLYLWPDELRGANPARYPSPAAYLEAVRHRPLDATFSYVTSRASAEAFFSESQFVGFGFSTALVSDGLRVLQVFPGSPAADAGIARGDLIIAIDGIAVTELAATGRLDAALGANQEGVSARVTVLARDVSPREVTLTKRVVRIPTVSMVRVYEAGGRRVGYLFFRNFVQPSYAALDAAFAELSTAQVDDLVLDLRYNGGGLVGVAQHLAGLIGGARTRGQVFAQYVHNDRNTYRNEVLRFGASERALAIDRLIVITTRASASASELVINGLRPFVPVILIGDRTFGKPVGQYQVPFCDKVLAPVSFVLRNADGAADYFGGFAPTCPAADDAEHALGDPAEASLREALAYAATGTCSSRTSRLERVGGSSRAAPAAGWHSVVNAY